MNQNLISLKLSEVKNFLKINKLRIIKLASILFLTFFICYLFTGSPTTPLLFILWFTYIWQLLKKKDYVSVKIIISLLIIWNIFIFLFISRVFLLN